MVAHPDNKVREVLFSMFPLSYRIKKVPIATDIMDRKLFIDSIKTLLEIEDRKDFMLQEIGIDRLSNFFPRSIAVNEIAADSNGKKQALVELLMEFNTGLSEQEANRVTKVFNKTDTSKTDTSSENNKEKDTTEKVVKI